MEAEAMPTTPMQRLQGHSLLAKVKLLGDASTQEKVKACGYYFQRDDGTERLCFFDFYQAVLLAESACFPETDAEASETTQYNIFFTVPLRMHLAVRRGLAMTRHDLMASLSDEEIGSANCLTAVNQGPELIRLIRTTPAENVRIEDEYGNILG
jgi:hypothetical protein